jgi:hypothetical protein
MLTHRVHSTVILHSTGLNHLLLHKLCRYLLVVILGSLTWGYLTIKALYYLEVWVVFFMPQISTILAYTATFVLQTLYCKLCTANFTGTCLC